MQRVQGQAVGLLGPGACRPAQGKEVELGGGTESGLTEGECRAWRADGTGGGVDAGARSGRPPDVAMMQATDLGNRDDPTDLRPLDWPSVGGIFVERKVSSRPVIVRDVAGQDAAQVRFTKDEHMVQTLAPDRADEPFREGVLPRAGRGGQDFPDAHALHAVPERVTVDLVTIAEEVGWLGVVREGVHNLLGRPMRGGMLGDVEVDDASAMVSEHDEDEEHPQACGGDREEIEGNQVPDVIGQERAPRLRGRRATLRNQPRDGALGHVDAELQELTVDSRGVSRSRSPSACPA